MNIDFSRAVDGVARRTEDSVRGWIARNLAADNFEKEIGEALAKGSPYMTMALSGVVPKELLENNKQFQESKAAFLAAGGKSVVIKDLKDFDDDWGDIGEPQTQVYFWLVEPPTTFFQRQAFEWKYGLKP